MTLTAAVSAADGSAATGNVIFLVDGQAVGPAVSLAVVNGQDIATFTTSLTTAGNYELSRSTRVTRRTREACRTRSTM